MNKMIGNKIVAMDESEVVKYNERMAKDALEIEFGPRCLKSRYVNTTSDVTFVSGKPEIVETTTDLTLDEVKTKMLSSISESFKEFSLRPRVSSRLGYDVDGSHTDLQNIKLGQKYNLPNIKDSDGILHPATTEDYDTAINAIELNGIALYKAKWEKELIVTKLLTIKECMLYEDTPYEATILKWKDPTTKLVPILDTVSGLQAEVTVTAYRNNCTAWS